MNDNTGEMKIDLRRRNEVLELSDLSVDPTVDDREHDGLWDDVLVVQCTQCARWHCALCECDHKPRGYIIHSNGEREEL